MIEEIKKPKVSVIIVTYNRPGMLRNAVASILGQTLQDFEIIITDYTEDWSVNQAFYDELLNESRVKWIRHKKNINNISLCWNEALDIIRGKYWCTLDDDNTKYIYYLERMTNFLDENPDKIAVVCPMMQTGYGTGVFYRKPNNYTELRTANHIDSGQVVYRREILEKIGNFDERLLAYDDWDYMLRVFSLNNMSGSAFGWLDGEPLCSYHWHNSKRMYHKDIEPITEKTGLFVANKAANNQILNEIRVYVMPVTPEHTWSQKQLWCNIHEALASIPFVTLVSDDPHLIIIPGVLWAYSTAQIIDLRTRWPNAKVMALLCEDPQGLFTNIQYSSIVDWMVTNDINAYKHYYENLQAPKKHQLLHWNCLSISNKLLNFIKGYDPEKIYDVCLVGHGYQGRREFINELFPKLNPGTKLALIGDDYVNTLDGRVKAYINGTMDEIQTAKIAMQSKIIILKHRGEKDLCGFSVVKPRSVNRGYIEAAYKAIVMIDEERDFHSFDKNTIITYKDGSDCANKINDILANYHEYTDIVSALYNKATEQFTHRERLIKILNCFRSVRYNKIII
ncbi:MAG: glycosyltransferase family A protein [Bacteroidota bacterium]